MNCEIPLRDDVTMKVPYSRDILNKALGHASRDGLLIFGFIIDPKQDMLTTFSSQEQSIEDVLFNAKVAITTMEKKDNGTQERAGD